MPSRDRERKLQNELRSRTIKPLTARMPLHRIAYIVKYFPLLTQTFVVGELCELRRRGIDVLILSLQRPSETLRHNIVERSGLDKLTVYDAETFPSRLREYQPQLLHAHFATDPTAAARTLAADLRIPFTFTAHGYDIYERPPADFAARAEAAAAIITVSEANKRQIVSNLAVSPEHISVIPNGVDTDFFCPTPKPEPPSEQAPTIVCVARHMPVKNLALLIEACAILRDRAIDFRCVLIGDGPGRSRLEEEVRRFRLEHHIELKGEMVRDQVLQWWHRAAVAVLSSHSEGMPISLIEAAACAVPAVATAVGGVPELVENSVSGLLIPPRNTAALADALSSIVTGPALAKEMGQAARRRAVEKFSLSRQMDRLIALWQGILERSVLSRAEAS